MGSDFLIQAFQLFRGNLYRALEDVTEAEAVIVANGYNNSILWNAGHLAVVAEQFLIIGTGQSWGLPQDYRTLFNRGTKPADWTIPAPTLADVIAVVKEQEVRVRDVLSGALDTSLPEPIQMRTVTIRTAAESLSFDLYHEGMHTGYIMAQKRAVRR